MGAVDPPAAGLLVIAFLGCLAILLALAVLALLLARRRPTSIVYGGCFMLSAALCAMSVFAVAHPPSSLVLPLGLPWIRAHFSLDALAAAFLGIVNLGAAAAS